MKALPLLLIAGGVGLIWFTMNGGKALGAGKPRPKLSGMDPKQQKQYDDYIDQYDWERGD